MTRLTRDLATMQKENIPVVSADVTFLSSRFPNYKIGADNQVLEVNNERRSLSMKEIVARETAMLLEQQKRLSVRDLASKFEKGLAAAAKLSGEDKLKETASLEEHVLLKKLRDALEALRGRVTGKNKDDVEVAIAMVEALAIQLAQREGDLLQEKDEVKKLANFLKQASEEAKRLVEEERSIARAEIDNARTAVQRVEEAIQEHENMSRAAGMQEDLCLLMERRVVAGKTRRPIPFSKNMCACQDYEDLMKEVQEARRIKILHQPSKVMDMEYELRALRAQLLEKSKHSVELQKELAIKKRSDDEKSHLYEMEGQELLGLCLRVQKRSDEAVEPAECTIQWYRLTSDSEKKELISGANKPVYAPEPCDVGRILQAEITCDGQKVAVSTTGPIDPAPGLGSYVEALVRKHDTEFNVILTQVNGIDDTSQSIHVLHVGKMRMKLCKGKTTVAKEFYSSGMQLCGVRGAGNAAAQAVFWQVKPGKNFLIAFESERERNAAIMLARRFAFDCNITLVGPGDRGT